MPAGHFGLIGIRERVEKLGGDFHLHSESGKGTTVEVTVPVDGNN
ncbi:MAG: ATP-binding protein [Chthoniobacter sp.]